MDALRFHPYHLLDGIPNVVVDGSPTESTTLTLSHWPGSPTPTDLLDDLSAQIAFHALGRPELFDGIEAVSNNHFDQDGLMSACALLQPDDAIARRARVIDVASAGDFATFQDRDSMRIAMAIAAHDLPDRSPLPAATFAGDYPEQCAAVYEAMLPHCVELLDHPDWFRALWETEDAHLTESLDAIDRGVVRVHEEPEWDLVVCEVPDEWATRSATRFTVHQQAALHPAALPNRTMCMRMLVSHGGHHRLECRYETWVMYQSRVLQPRPDLRVLAAHLHDLEPDAGWRADAPGGLTPAMEATVGTGLSLESFLAEVRTFLATARPSWDPYAAV
ncbi:MAG: hypothetical protein HY828_12250 [Actinobacteria bacterium]|nr:hypothetical protein [Actinomycetota bacterium]